jgi:predicted O-methyltransferase YrrM
MKRSCPAAKVRILAAGAGEKWPQHLDEIEEFLNLLNSESVRSYLEIGISHGFTFRYVGNGLPVGAQMVGVDYHGVWTPHLRKTMDLLNERGQGAEIVWGDSTDPDVVEKVRKRGPYDCVLIDGDHSYETVALDWSNYGPMARMVAFHDIDAEHSPKWSGKKFRNRFGVPRFFNELKHKYRHVKIISKTQPGMGIGVVWTRPGDFYDPTP